MLILVVITVREEKLYPEKKEKHVPYFALILSTLLPPLDQISGKFRIEFCI